jgi:1-acyl-sn-glycerol-3-phosphate acyltransferase
MRTYYRLTWLFANSFVKHLLCIEKKGMENIPEKGGIIIASNHISVYDPPLLGLATPRELFYLAKRELFKNKLFAWLITKFNAIPLKRDRFDKFALFQAVEILKSGKVLLLFPEGTRNLGDGFLKLKPGVGMIALKAQVPIVPVLVENSQKLPWNVFKRKKVKIRFGTPIRWSWLKEISANKDGYKKICDEILQRFLALKEKN